MTGYAELLSALKERIRSAQFKAALSVNRELVLLYWQIGQEILTRQAKENWGAKVIDRLAADLKREFFDMSGFSPRNLKYMRAFAALYKDKAFVQEVLAQITWYHNITLLDKVKNSSEREWYIRKTIENGWSRNVLVLQIENDLYHRQINFYLSALDDIVKAPEDNPSIGIILCATKDRVLAEYALRDIKKPIGVAEWKTKLTRSLPKKLKGNLPTIEEIEAELEN
ncbi:MAG: DUF1016 domain-containing protein [Nitrospirae bacterium]|nr:DUF1016 domain-containing protein [Nitrospirota bacterium]